MDNFKDFFAAAAQTDERFYNIQYHTQMLASMERNASYSDIERSTRYCMQMLEESGFEKVERITHRADGITAANDLIMPEAWDRTGRCSLEITDSDVSEFERMLADTDLDPLAAVIWSAPLPEGGIDCELVDFDSLDPENPEVEGKFVLLGNDKFSANYRKLAAANASGLAIYNLKAEDTEPYGLHWYNGQGRFGWYLSQEDKKLPLFSLAPYKARFIKKLLQSRKINVHAEMNTRIYPGNIYTVTGIIPGESSEEYALLAHIYEPFAGDDALGAALGAEIGKILKDCKITPRKTLRLVLSMELFGFAAYMVENERYKNMLAAMSLDGFTHRCSPEISFRFSPISAPFFGDYFLRGNGHRMLPDAPWSEKYGNLSDDTFAGDCSMNVPTNWFYNPSGIHHHNSGTGFLPDWVLVRERFPMLADSVLQLICNRTFPDFVPEALAEYKLETAYILQNDNLSAREKDFYIREKCNFHIARLESVKTFDSTYTYQPGELFSERDNALKQLPALEELSDLEKELAAITVERTCLCCPTSLAKIPYTEKRSYPCIMPRMLFAQFDGKRNLLEAIWRTACNANDKYTAEQYRATVQYLQYVEKYGYVKLHCSK